MLNRLVAQPVVRIADVMRRLAEGDNNVAVPGVGRGDEIGQMAAAVEVFKDAAAAKLRAEQEAIEIKARGEREREAASEAAIAGERTFVVDVFGQSMERLAGGRPDLSRQRRAAGAVPQAARRLQRRHDPAPAGDAGDLRQRRGHHQRRGRDQPGRRRPVAPHRAAGRDPGGDRRGPRPDHRHGEAVGRRRRQGP